MPPVVQVALDDIGIPAIEQELDPGIFIGPTDQRLELHINAKTARLVRRIFETDSDVCDRSLKLISIRGDRNILFTNEINDELVSAGNTRFLGPIFSPDGGRLALLWKEVPTNYGKVTVAQVDIPSVNHLGFDSVIGSAVGDIAYCE